jgi:uncharacterized protein
MRLTLTILATAAAALLLMNGNSLVSKLGLQLHPNAFINALGKYQLLALALAAAVLISTLLVEPKSKGLLSIGNLSEVAVKEKWLGINGTTTWLSNGLWLLLFISMATGIFMFLGLKYSNSLNNFQWWFMPYVLLFSFTNAFAEEIIFRFGIISALEGHASKLSILLISGILFGLPHYFGNPGGPIGIVMAGILGYVLCKATLETKGLAVAVGIHFVQDVIIFTAVMMMNVKASAG